MNTFKQVSNTNRFTPLTASVIAEQGLRSHAVNDYKKIITHSNRGWLCNISKHYRFSDSNKRYLTVQSTSKHNQFDILCKLLTANTCDTIYIDEPLTTAQLATVRVLQGVSNTKILHARLSQLFSNVQ
ncbi:MAG: hypothetical protein WA981_09340 [Glaciecola sp.]